MLNGLVTDMHPDRRASASDVSPTDAQLAESRARVAEMAERVAAAETRAGAAEDQLRVLQQAHAAMQVRV